MATRYNPRAKRLHDAHLSKHAAIAAAAHTPTPAYNPTGITAMARQHPLLIRTEEDLDHLAKARARQEARAAKRSKLAGVAIRVLDGADHPGPSFSRAEQRRLEKRARKALL